MRQQKVLHGDHLRFHIYTFDMFRFLVDATRGFDLHSGYQSLCHAWKILSP